MKSPIVAIAFVAVSSLDDASAFSMSSFSGTQVASNVQNKASMSMEYIPSGMSKEQWRKVKEQEKKKAKGKNLGKTGITSFKSRSFADWQKSGGKNLFPVDPKSVKNEKDLPYMQRKGGSADDADLKKKPLFNFSFGKKKEEPVEEEPPKKKNPWTF